MKTNAIQHFHNSPCIRVPGHAPTCDIMIGPGAIKELPAVMEKLGAHSAYVFADRNTYAAAGKTVCQILQDAGKDVAYTVFEADPLEPDERSVGLAAMHLDLKCDAIIGVGSGVMNDTCKIIANLTGKPYIIVATAPSMDGYASATSSMERQGMKVSINSKCPDTIIGDTDILTQAPKEALVSGLGDMLAKYVSICEWRISHLINGEFYSADIADMVRLALKKCVDHADGLLLREPSAVEAVFEGLSICGIAMSYAGLSRPASGGEHYFSHVLDMRGAQFKTPTSTHGLQCGMATLLMVRLYEKLKSFTPERQKALAYVDSFCYDDWCKQLRKLLGAGAETMIALEAREGKYDKAKHAARLETILANWDGILQIIEQELPPLDELEALLDKLGAPKSLGDIGIEETLLPVIFSATRDIRDKYVLSRLLWDLGIAPEEIL